VILIIFKNIFNL